MAAINGHLTYHVIDADNVKKPLDLFFHCTSGLLVDIEAYAQAIGNLLDPILAVQILKVTVELNLSPDMSAWKVVPDAGSIVEQTALETWAVVGSVNAFGFDLPGFKPSKFTGNQVDTGDSAVAAFNLALVTATDTCTASDRYFNLFSELIRAVKTFRKSRRGLSRA